MRLLVFTLALALAPVAQEAVQDEATGLWGTRGPDGSWLVEPRFTDVRESWTDPVTGDVFVRAVDGDGVGLLKNGRLVIPTEFAEVGNRPNWRWEPHRFHMRDPAVLVEGHDGREGLYSVDGDVLLEPVYRAVLGVGPYVAAQIRPGTIALYQSDGTPATPATFAHVSYACEGVCPGSPRGLSGDPERAGYDLDRDLVVVRDRVGGPIRLLRARDLSPVDVPRLDGVLTWERWIVGIEGTLVDGRFTFLDYDGRAVVEGSYDNVSSLSQPMRPYRYVAVAREGRWAVLDILDGTETPFVFDALQGVMPDPHPDPARLFFKAQRDGRWGLVRPDGEWLVAPEYDNLHSYRSSTDTITGVQGEESRVLVVGS